MARANATVGGEEADSSGECTLFVLIVPALVSAYLGAGAAWLVRRLRP